MRILTYKRTHTGDPNPEGIFGIADCMGKVRGYDYDAVIGVGGTGSEPHSHGIDGKITWIGVHPKKHIRTGLRGPLITFERFVLFDANGPMLSALGPALAKRMFVGRARYLLIRYSDAEQVDAESIVQWAIEATEEVEGTTVKKHRGIAVQCVCKQGQRPARC
jgi:hypothetical protein